MSPSRRSGSACPRSAAWVTSWPRRSPPSAPYADLDDLVRRVRIPLPVLEALATAGAFGCFGLGRREAIWAVGALAHTGPDQLPGTTPGSSAPPLPPMTPIEMTFADLWATGSSADSHPVQHVRPTLDRWGVLPAAALTRPPSTAPGCGWADWSPTASARPPPAAWCS